MPHVEELWAQVAGLEQVPPGSATWGAITGTLSDQLDLQAALDAKLDDSQAGAFGLVLLSTPTAADARTALVLVPGTDVQPYDADLAALAGLATAADTLPYFTGSAAAALTSFTAFARSLLDDANALTARATLGLVIGTDVQAQDAELQAIAGLVSAADRLPYFTGSGTAALATFTAGGRALVNSAGTADTFPYFSASNTVTLGAITSAGRALIDDATAADQRTTLGLVIGTDVQAWDAELQALAGLVSAADQLPYFTGSGTAALTTLTAFARTLIDDTTAANARTTLGLGTADSPTFAALTVTGLSALASVTVSSTLGVTGLSTLATAINNGSLQSTKSVTTAFTPQWQMHGTGVTAATGSAQGWFRWSNDVNAPNTVYSKSRGNAIGTHTIVADGDIVGRIGFNASDGVAFFEAARIQANVSGTPAVGSVPGSLVFSTTSVGSSSASAALTLANDQSAAFAAHVNAPTTMVVGNTAAIPANTRMLIDRQGSGTLPTLSGGTVLTLQGNNAASSGAFLAIISGTAGVSAVRFGDSGSAVQGRIDYDNSTDMMSFYASNTAYLTLSSAGVLSAAGAFNASSGAFNTTTLRAFNSGGAVTPVLQVNGPAAATASLGLGRWSNLAAGPALITLGFSAGAGVGTHALVADTNVLGRVSFNGSDGVAFQEAACIEAFVNGTPGANDMPGALRFMTTPDGSTTAATVLTLGQDKSAVFAGLLNSTQIAVGDATLRAFRADGSTTTANLQHNGTTNNTSALALGRWNATPAGPSVILGASASSVIGTHSLVAANTVLGRLSFNGSDGVQFQEAARIDAIVGATSGASDMPGALRFWTTPDGSTTPGLALTIGHDKLASFAGALTTVGTALVNGATQGFLGVLTGSSGATANTSRDDLVIELSGAGGMSILSPGAETVGIAFGDAGSAVVGQMRYNHNTDLMDFITNGTARLALDATGAAVTGSVSVTGGIDGANIYNTYTPTLTAITNVSASSANVSGWIRIGNAVLVFAQISVTATAAAALTVIDLSLPVASALSAATQVVGAGSILTAGTEVAAVAVSANATNDRARATFVSTSNAARTYTVVFGYIVI